MEGARADARDENNQKLSEFLKVATLGGGSAELDQLTGEEVARIRTAWTGVLAEFDLMHLPSSILVNARGELVGLADGLDGLVICAIERRAFARGRTWRNVEQDVRRLAPLLSPDPVDRVPIAFLLLTVGAVHAPRFRARRHELARTLDRRRLRTEELANAILMAMRRYRPATPGRYLAKVLAREPSPLLYADSKNRRVHPSSWVKLGAVLERDEEMLARCERLFVGPAEAMSMDAEGEAIPVQSRPDLVELCRGIRRLCALHAHRHAGELLRKLVPPDLLADPAKLIISMGRPGDAQLGHQIKEALRASA